MTFIRQGRSPAADEYERNALRIGKELEAAFPELREDTAGKDFRPGGGGEKIVSGILFKRLVPPDFCFIDNSWRDELQADPYGPITFKVIFGAAALLEAAAEKLEAAGIVCLRSHPTELTFCLEFSLPQDFTIFYKKTSGLPVELL